MTIRNTIFSLLLLIVLSLGTGCGTVVRPPTGLHDSVTVYLTDQTIHSSVILPVGTDGKYVEYAFGDWTYAALNKHDPWHTLEALFFSQQGALGRRYHQMPAGSEKLPSEFDGITMNTFQVDRETARALLAQLDERFDSGKSKARNEDTQFDWATVDDSYALWNNCNSLTKSNLRKLDCKVETGSVFAMYDVKMPNPLVYANTSPVLPWSVDRAKFGNKMR